MPASTAIAIFAAQEAFTDPILAAMKQPMVLGSSTFEYEGVTFNRILIPRYVLERYETSEYEILPGQLDERVKAVKKALCFDFVKAFRRI